jgi:methylthioribose-1-phosphate isomerase
VIRTIEWIDGKVKMIDQTKLPHKEEVLEYEDYHDIAAAIKSMKVRGAPAIGVAAAFGVALGARHSGAQTTEDLLQEIEQIYNVLIETRPTAVNLKWALDRMRDKAQSSRSLDVLSVERILEQEAILIAEEDVETNRKIGEYGARLLSSGDTVLTHCNAGALATSEYGTALGVIRRAVEEGKDIDVFVDETRPLLQGARLTAWELQKENIPHTLIADNMAGYFMSQGKIDKVLVGADRIASNGDVANKIGTYSLAVLAKEHGIPFYVAAPVSTIDFGISAGGQIPIEQREAKEVTSIQGVGCAPLGVKVANPAFDVTPNRYIAAIITERGIVEPPYRTNLKKIGQKKDERSSDRTE